MHQSGLQWEYQWLQANPRQSIQILNDLGRLGWEVLRAPEPTDEMGTYFLKRLLTPISSRGAESPVTEVGVEGREFRVGSMGPGGGVIFFDAGTRKSWGRYLEAAPRGWHNEADDPQCQWCSHETARKVVFPTSVHVGSGSQNTLMIIEACGNETAAALAASYRGGGFSDWFLPARDELQVLSSSAEFLSGSPTSQTFWSSSHVTNRITSAWCHSVRIGAPGDRPKRNHFHVRPIRAF